LLDWLRNLFDLTPRCEKCGKKMIRSGWPKDGWIQHYKCPDCGRDMEAFKEHHGLE